METMTNDLLEQVYEVGTPAELSLTTVSGEVRIQGADSNQIRVRAEKSGRDSARANTRIDIQQEGNRVVIHTRADSTFANFGGRNLASVEYDITVPRDCALAVKTVSAEVTASGTRAGSRLETVSGDVLVEDLTGASSVTTVSGDVTATGLSGSLTLHTTSGDARVERSSLRGFNLHSVSGDFEIETPLTRGEHYYAQTVSGDLWLAVPDGTGLTVQMRSVSGEVISELRNADIIKSGRRHWQGRINGGGANVEMQSVSGDLRITGGGVSDAAPPPADSEQAGAAAAERGTDEDASRVLGLLEQGEIDVDEALTRLKGMGR